MFKQKTVHALFKLILNVVMLLCQFLLWKGVLESKDLASIQEISVLRPRLGLPTEEIPLDVHTLAPEVQPALRLCCMCLLCTCARCVSTESSVTQLVM